LALYRQLSIQEVLDDLDLALPELEGRSVTANAACQARQRLGAEPLHWLFQTSAKAWQNEDRSAYQLPSTFVLRKVCADPGMVCFNSRKLASICYRLQ